MVAGKTYTIRMMATQNGFDPYLYLKDPRGMQVREDDDGGNGLDSLIVYTAPANGVYTILASTYNEREFGTYRLTVDEN